MVPAVLAVFFAAALAEGSVALLGLAANIMFFTVGWHYAKQGYGILMLDAARKGIRFGPAERRRLLWNTHLAWVVNWLVANDALAAKELWGITYYRGITYYLIDVPDALLIAMVAAVAVSTLAVGRDLFATWRAKRVFAPQRTPRLRRGGLRLAGGEPHRPRAPPRRPLLPLPPVPGGSVWRYQINVDVDRRRVEVEHVESEVQLEGYGCEAPQSDSPASSSRV